MDVRTAIASVRPKKWLSDKVWNEDGLKPEIANALARIAKKFLDDLELELDVIDIIMTGSYAGKTWGSGSDLDLHIIIDFSDYEDPEAAKQACKLAKFRWEEEHDIEIHGIPVEVYVEDADDPPPESTGRWSIPNNKWILEPPGNGVSFDESKVMDKVRDFREVIRKAASTHEEKPMIAAMKRITKLRKAGLERSGEMSNENLAYRVLRRTGELEQAWDLMHDIVDKKLSV